MDPERLGARPTDAAPGTAAVPLKPNWSARPTVEQEDEPAAKKQKT